MLSQLTVPFVQLFAGFPCGLRAAYKTSTRREKGREEETPVFKESILIQVEHGYAIIWFDTADNLVSCRSRNKSRHCERGKGDRSS